MKYLLEDLLPGGKGDNLNDADVNPTELRKGIKVELEHIKDPNKAKEIAKDHLAEKPEYYTRLARAGLADELKDSDYTDLVASTVNQLLGVK
jgi:hypothetical protein